MAKGRSLRSLLRQWLICTLLCQYDQGLPELADVFQTVNAALRDNGRNKTVEPAGIDNAKKSKIAGRGCNVVALAIRE